jgi:hypothetical protein
MISWADRVQAHLSRRIALSQIPDMVSLPIARGSMSAICVLTRFMRCNHGPSSDPGRKIEAAHIRRLIRS